MSAAPEGAKELPLLVAEGEAAKSFYSFAKLSFLNAAEGVLQTAAIVLISKVQDRYLVAVPQELWSRRTADRLLPARALERPVLCEVAVALTDKPGVVVEGECMKLWIGVLARSLEGRLAELLEADTVDYSVEYVDVGDHEERMPFGQALAELAEDHFAFQSAGELLSAGSAGDLLVEKRMAVLEESLGTMQEALQQLVARQESQGIGEQPALLEPRESRGGPTPKKVPRKKKAAVPEEGDLPGLDPSVIQSARIAGVPESQLRSLSHLMTKNTKMQDQPAMRAKQKKPKAVNVLSESEEEDAVGEAEGAEVEEEGEEGGGSSSTTPVEKAVLQLTQIVDSMAKKPARDLEALLDGAEGGSGELGATAGGMGKSKAAAYKRLRAALKENPSYVFQTIEDLMDADFLQSRTAPGALHQATSSRAWVEHRSKVLNYPSSVRAIWALAAIHDCLKMGAIQEARARAAVAIAAWDQCSLDNGSWLMSQEVLLEPPPPYAAFQMKKLPDPAEQPASRLLDERWLAVLQWKLRDQDNYLETKKRLTVGRQRPDPRNAVGEEVKPTPKVKPTKPPKGGGKGQKGASQEAGDPTQ